MNSWRLFVLALSGGHHLQDQGRYVSQVQTELVLQVESHALLGEALFVRNAPQICEYHEDVAQQVATVGSVLVPVVEQCVHTTVLQRLHSGRLFQIGSV